jgi:hypothetical protein
MAPKSFKLAKISEGDGENGERPVSLLRRFVLVFPSRNPKPQILESPNPKTRTCDLEI